MKVLSKGKTNIIFRPGDYVRHFRWETLSEEEKKSDLYVYVVCGLSRHTETGEYLVIYKPLYSCTALGDAGLAARPLSMFLSEVDHEKYPDIKQKYRFDKWCDCVGEKEDYDVKTCQYGSRDAATSRETICSYLA